ncbi:hypothetical protein [Shewanella litoralis]|uniref:DUF2946 domain-containing protein n=1 Tax=Shewanella litoralis TaxID=2282700 RepID=A0ABQ2QYP1_9GAMM|nr:hypothetical protein [Shewanella litoralis]GGQ04116.1 hypothetical protein GCM10009411_01540 [Shewanella litoralis]
MRKSIRLYLIAICTLLSLIGQGVLANGHTMIMPSDMKMNQQMITKVMSNDMQNGTDCHSMMQDQTDITTSASHCCDNATGCTNDCSHCFTITFTGTIFSTNIAISPIPEDTAVTLPLAQLFSIDGSPAFRPPIV